MSRKALVLLTMFLCLPILSLRAQAPSPAQAQAQASMLRQLHGLWRSVEMKDEEGRGDSNMVMQVAFILPSTALWATEVTSRDDQGRVIVEAHTCIAKFHIAGDIIVLEPVPRFCANRNAGEEMLKFRVDNIYLNLTMEGGASARLQRFGAPLP